MNGLPEERPKLCELLNEIAHLLFLAQSHPGTAHSKLWQPSAAYELIQSARKDLVDQYFPDLPEEIDKMEYRRMVESLP